MIFKFGRNMLLFMNMHITLIHICTVLCNVNTTGIYGILVHIFFQRTYTYFINILDFPEYYSPDVWMVVEWRSRCESLLNQIFYANNFFVFGHNGVLHLNESKATKNIIRSVTAGDFSETIILLRVYRLSVIFLIECECHCLYKSISLPSSNLG